MRTVRKRIRTTVDLPQELIPLLKAYRKTRVETTGKFCTNNTAIVELLQQALQGVQPVTPVNLVKMQQDLQQLQQTGNAMMERQSPAQLYQDPLKST